LTAFCHNQQEGEHFFYPTVVLNNAVDKFAKPNKSSNLYVEKLWKTPVQILTMGLHKINPGFFEHTNTPYDGWDGKKFFYSFH